MFKEAKNSDGMAFSIRVHGLAEPLVSNWWTFAHSGARWAHNSAHVDAPEFVDARARVGWTATIGGMATWHR